MITPAVNELHAMLRKQSIDEGIRLIRAQIQQRGYDLTKADPGVQAWIMEHRDVLETRSKLGGLGGETKH